MRSLIKNQRGHIRTIEAFFAVVLLLSSITLFAKTQSTATDTNESLSSTAYSTLLSLDSDGKIGVLIENESWAEIKELVQTTLPLAAWFNLTVFDKNMVCLNEIPICTGSAVSDQITSLDYICAGINSNYAVYLVRLQVSAVD